MSYSSNSSLLLLTAVLVAATACTSASNNQPPPECTPSCGTKVCGADGCGGICGTCPAAERCNLQGACEPDCTLSCAGRGCGDSVCTGPACCAANDPDCTPPAACSGVDLCGTCTSSTSTTTSGCNPMSGQCEVCTDLIDCSTVPCGDDGCFGLCPDTCDTQTEVCIANERRCCEISCEPEQCGIDPVCGVECPTVCQGNQVCSPIDSRCCTPNCDGTMCGDDGCGGTCSCNGNDICNQQTFQCEGCTPIDCTNRQCGADGCGGNCGMCGQDEACNETTGQCENCPADCSTVQGECVSDTCCPCAGGGTLSCTGGGRCHCGECVPESCDGRGCRTDGCGTPCITCNAGEVCTYDGARDPPHQCVPFAAPDATMNFFITSEGNRFNGGNFGGIAGADALCQNLADAAGAGGRTWRAYMSVQGQNARDRIGAGPWFNAFGEQIVDANCGMAGQRTCLDALHEDGLDSKYLATERGFHIEWEEAHDILTGSDTNGIANGIDCNQWTSNNGAVMAQVGHADGVGGPPDRASSWNSQHETPCEYVGAVCNVGRGFLYCFSP